MTHRVETDGLPNVTPTTKLSMDWRLSNRSNESSPKEELESPVAELLDLRYARTRGADKHAPAQPNTLRICDESDYLLNSHGRPAQTLTTGQGESRIREYVRSSKRPNGP